MFSTCPSPASRPRVCQGIAMAWAGQSLSHSPPPSSVHCCKLAQILLVFSGHTANPLFHTECYLVSL